MHFAIAKRSKRRGRRERTPVSPADEECTARASRLSTSRFVPGFNKSPLQPLKARAELIDSEYGHARVKLQSRKIV